MKFIIGTNRQPIAVGLAKPKMKPVLKGTGGSLKVLFLSCGF
ncbi:hypothetical protein [Flavobacterium gawalongense]|nr:hypothetical protein [Flavobacterium gawalongense]